MIIKAGQFKQKIKITMIDISSKNLKELCDIYILNRFNWGQNQIAKIAPNIKALPQLLKIKLLTSGILFAVNRY